MERKITYGYAGKSAKKHHRMSIMLCFAVLFAVSLLAAKPVKAVAATGLKIQHNKKTQTYIGTKLTAHLDKKDVDLHHTPGLAFRNRSGELIYMLSAADVFRDGCGISYSYKDRKITLKQYDITVKMTVGSKTAYVNGKKTQLDYPPSLIKFYNVNKTKLYLPAKFVATTYGYTYNYQRISSNRVMIKMTTPDYIRYNEKWNRSRRPVRKLTFDGENVNVSDMYCFVVDNYFYVQAKAFAKEQIGGSYSYKPSTNEVTLKYDGQVLKMVIGKTKATLNGKAITMAKAPKIFYSSKYKKDFVMVPVASVATRLCMNYVYNSKAGACALTRKDEVYFKWEKTEPVVTPDEPETAPGEEGVIEVPEEDEADEGDYVSGTTGERIGNTDVISMDGHFPKENVNIWDSGSTVYVQIIDCKNKVGKESITLLKPYLLKSANLSQNADGYVTLKIVKKSVRTRYNYSVEDGYASIILTNEVFKNGYKIAVDVGHGAYTPGKRTPGLLESLDFNKDGIIDAKKGTQIREHTANVGVGNYAVAALERCGFEVYKSGFGSYDTPLTTRQNNIRNAKSDYSISIHFDAAGSGSSFNSASGIGVYSHANSTNAKNSYSLAKAILNTTKGGTVQKNRGINREHTFAMCNANAMGTKASILLECAFMTNWHEVKTMMANTAYWEETGEEIAKGFCNYLGVEYIAPY